MPQRRPQTIVHGTSINPMRNAEGAAVIEVRGEVDTANAQRLRQLISDACRQRPTAIIVDLLFVTFIDSVGIGALVAGYNAAGRLGIPYRVRRPSPFITRQLRQIGLYDLLTAPPS